METQLSLIQQLNVQNKEFPRKIDSAEQLLYALSYTENTPPKEVMSFLKKISDEFEPVDLPTLEKSLLRLPQVLVKGQIIYV